jgi:hypothetical protein
MMVLADVKTRPDRMELIDNSVVMARDEKFSTGGFDNAKY